MHSIHLTPERTDALLTALVGLHAEIGDAHSAATLSGDHAGAELAQTRLAAVDDLLSEIGDVFPEQKGWRL